MVKQRMTALDVRATVEEMRATLIGLRLLNIYNIGNKMFLFKFGHGENKKNVLLESGTRFHLTELAREKPKVPSQFTLKLRKHIRAWRLDSIAQLQHDRTIDLCFGVPSTEGCFHIIVELFSKGNVILTDYAYTIMMLLRTHRDDEGLKLMVNQVYPVTAPFVAAVAAESAEAQEVDTATVVSAAASVARTAAAAAEEPHMFLYPPHVDASGHLHVQHTADADLTLAQRQLKEERTRLMKVDWEVGLSRSNDRTVVQTLVAGIQHFGPDLAQHVLTVTGVLKTPRKSWTQSADNVFEALRPGLLEAFDLAKVDLTSAGGYLIKPKAKPASTAHTPAPPAPGASAAAADLVAVAEQYESFTPILLAQYTNDGVEALYRTSFGRVCDEFFLITETERIDASNAKRTKTAKSKEDKFAADHARRINALETDIAANQMKGEQLILNADRVDEAIQLINGALATGISWDALRMLLKRRHAEGHPVAYMIHDLFLERNSISVLLETVLDEEKGEEDCDVPPLVVEVTLSKTAHANAADYFSKQKQHRSKLERTVAATEKAAAGAARKGARKAAAQKEKKVIVKERQRNWWEKFFWFRTTAGDLVLRGKDVQSTELLVRRVMRLGDLFIHCDVDGSLPCLLRPMNDVWQELGGNNAGGDLTASPATQPVALHSVCEAGAWCVAFSGAWERKQTTGSWWVYASQVTGGTATGAYLYAGERHHLPPQSMSLGCALLFYVARTVREPAAVARAESAASVDNDDEGPEHVEDDAVDSFTVLRRELPSFLASPADAGQPSGAGEAVVPADAAAALVELPSVETLRAEQRKQRNLFVAGGCNSSGGGRVDGRQKKGKAAKKGGARNSRVDRAGLQGTPAATIAFLPSSAMEDGAAAAVAATATQKGSAQGRNLTKHQKKKLKKIQDKYGDQDDEDRMLGAQVNGNQLSRVQLLELQRRAEQRQEAEQAKRTHEKANLSAQRVFCTPQYRSLGNDNGQEDAEEEEEGEDVEVVSEFTDDGKEAETNVAVVGAAAAAEAGGSDEEDEHAAAVEEAGGGCETEEEEEATEAGAVASTAARSRNDRDAAIVQQSAELNRAFPHYTMRPGPMDTVQHVVVVCAPTIAVSEYAYHATLCMGNAKKGALAAKLLQLFTARAEQGEAGADGTSTGVSAVSPGAQGSKAKKTAAKKGSGGAPTDCPRSPSWAPSPAAATVNPSVVKALQMMSTNDVVEQLRANVKPIEFHL
ncbi:translation-associated element 2 [Leishmania donovani]|uniref:Translation-associated_element_2_putative/GeneDB: LmjF.09.0940 n=1 Tax=Leishmania donovani TaxID=5661 RepID=A0A6J8F4Z9_LEIDO|nr:translation-associated element 2 [Leishmania donovani]VDZ42503.1 translation-associated_element_2_putative/GeneDB:LmjF.09.0940 [Leishmania donovani]